MLWYFTLYRMFEKVTNFNCPLCRAPVPTKTSDAFARLQRRVAKGDAEAQIILGSAYEDGRYGLKKSMKRAAYELSAAQGYMLGQYNLGNAYANGTGVKMDKKKALEYYFLSAEQGHANAQCAIGDCYYLGEGVEPDFRKSLRWYERAAAQGHQDAQHNLAVLQGARS